MRYVKKKPLLHMLYYKMKIKINRNTYIKLLEWKDSKNRKPLLLRGARQVGKTTLVRQFAKASGNALC